MMDEKKAMALLMAGVLLVSPLLAMTAYAEKGKELRGGEEHGRLTVTNGVMTVMVTAEGKHPQFFWYANNQNKTIYHVKYKGIIEYFDTGQQIFQRKFTADLEKFIRASEIEIKSINASKVNSKVTLVGEIRENRERATERIFGHILQEGNSRIGVNTTKDTVIRGALRGQVVVQGTVALSGRTVYIKAISIAGLDAVREESRQNTHPAFFEFNQGKWRFSGFQPLRTGNKVIGYQFDYTLGDINNKLFGFLKDQVIIRNRIYNTTVKEGEILVPIASMKTDIIIKSWRWNLNTTEGRLLNLNMSRDRLAVWLELTAFADAKVEDALAEKAKPSLTHVQTGRERIETRENKEARGEDERKLESGRDDHRITFLSGNKVLGGYFNFSNTAVVYPRVGSPSQGEKVRVAGAYLGDENKIRVFLLYPNFGAKSLEHDPSIGVSVQEPVVPEYNVDPILRRAEQPAPAPAAPAPAPAAPAPAPAAPAPAPAAPAPQPQEPAPQQQVPAPAPQPQPQVPAVPGPQQPPQPESSRVAQPAIGDTTTVAIAGVLGAVVVIAVVAIAIRRKP